MKQDSIRQHPVFSENKLKLGVFAFNGGNNARTLIPERYKFSWDNSVDVATQADLSGFEAIVPYARYRGFVRASHPSAFAFDNFTWTSAIAAQTHQSCVMSTCHVMNFHPILVAKTAATLDHISRGRFALNIVCGWYDKENEMFGHPDLDHDERYAYADEWVTIMKRLWTDEEEFDFEGKYFKVTGAMSQPKPLQKPYPVLMNAGGSPQGRAFVAKHCDIAFVRSDSFEMVNGETTAYRQLARDQHGREIQVWATCACILGDTEADAEAFAARCREHADSEFINYYLSQRRNMTPEALAALRDKYAMGGSGYILKGNKNQVADQILKLSQAGLDGILLTWVDFQNGIRRFNRDVIPLLKEAGLRQN